MWLPAPIHTSLKRRRNLPQSNRAGRSIPAEGWWWCTPVHEELLLLQTSPGQLLKEASGEKKSLPAALTSLLPFRRMERQGDVCLVSPVFASPSAPCFTKLRLSANRGLTLYRRFTLLIHFKRHRWWGRLELMATCELRQLIWASSPEKTSGSAAAELYI